MKECKCRTGKCIPLTDVNYSGVETVLFPKLKFIRTRVYLTEDSECGIFDTQDIINVEYCTFCGRRF